METLTEKIAKINDTYNQKQREALEKLAEERSMAIARETVDDVVNHLPSMSMGNIISIFENISSEVLKTKGGKSRINAFLSLVKEDKNIHNSYMLKENVFSVTGIENPKEYIIESIAVANETNKVSEFNASKKKIAEFLSETIKSVNPLKIAEKVVLDEETKKINDNLETLMWGKKTVQKTAERMKCINETIDFMVGKNEIPVKSKEDMFEHYKNECINSLNEAWENADANVRIKLTEMKDRVSKKSYSELTVDNDIRYLKELIQTVK